MLSVIYAKCPQIGLYAECHYAECCYAECRYAEGRYAEGRYAECRYATLNGAIKTHKKIGFVKMGPSHISNNLA
jgi:hypothetical protein